MTKARDGAQLTDALIVFLKAPRPGSVKTRLVPAFGPALAARLYRALAEEVMQQTVPRAADYERLLFFAPAEARAEMEAWFPGETWMAQQGDDLGARMSAAFEEAFRRGARRAAIVGSDMPWLTRERVLEGLRALDGHDLVLGPAADGGYYMLALGGRQPGLGPGLGLGLFKGIAWSTPSVFAATVERAGVLGLTTRLLDVLPDVDTVADVQAAWPRLRSLLDPTLAADLERALAI